MNSSLASLEVETTLAGLSLEDKAGCLFHAMAFVIPGGPGDGPQLGPVRHHILNQRINHFAVMGPASPETISQLATAISAVAEEAGLNVPITLSSDPRNVVADRPGHASAASGFSEWPEPLGIAATRDPDIAFASGRATAEEFRSSGIHVLLGPQLDVLTELRWARGTGTFGGDIDLIVATAKAYLRGLHGTSPASRVSAVVKHFPGAGPQTGGEDSHFPYGKDQTYPGGHFDLHLQPFIEMLAEGVTQVMPYYSKPVGTRFDEVGFAFNHAIITGILRDQLGFDGLVLSDFGILTDQELMGERIQARAWGLEDSTVETRILRALDAGVDQFGGEATPEVVVRLVREGRLDEGRLDQSVRRVLKEKSALGLIDELPLPALPEHRREELRLQGHAAQQAAITFLKRPSFTVDHDSALVTVEPTGPTDRPLPRADQTAVVFVGTPFEQRDGFFEAMFPAGSLEYPQAQVETVLGVCRANPTIVVVDLTRPAILTPFVDAAAGLLVHYGSSQDAILEVLRGEAEGRGQLPVQLPRTMDDATKGDIDQPRRIDDPLYDFGHGYQPTQKEKDR